MVEIKTTFDKHTARRTCSIRRGRVVRVFLGAGIGIRLASKPARPNSAYALGESAMAMDFRSMTRIFVSNDGRINGNKRLKRLP